MTGTYLIREYTATARPTGANVYASTLTIPALCSFDHVDQAPPRCMVISNEANVVYPTTLKLCVTDLPIKIHIVSNAPMILPYLFCSRVSAKQSSVEPYTPSS